MRLILELCVRRTPGGTPCSDPIHWVGFWVVFGFLLGSYPEAQ